MNFQSLPKIELHLHLDCSLSFDVVSQLRPAIRRREFERDFIAPAKCTNLADFLTRAPRGVSLMQTEAALRLVTEDLFRQLTNDGIVYAEIRFAPLLHIQGELDAETVVAVVDETCRRMALESDVETRLILCTLRHFSEEQSLETVQLVEKFRGSSVVALDIAADEAGFPLDAHISAFRYAQENNIHRTAHAGEARGAESVWETLKKLQPTRIGHGVRSIEDHALIEHLKDHRIHLEICPTSNIQTDVVDTIPDHPVDGLYRKGISLGINTDARTITNVTLSGEYELLHRTFGWGPADFLSCNLEALRAAFLPERIKTVIESRIRAGYSSG